MALVSGYPFMTAPFAPKALLGYLDLCHIFTNIILSGIILTDSFIKLTIILLGIIPAR